MASAQFCSENSPNGGRTSETFPPPAFFTAAKLSESCERRSEAESSPRLTSEYALVPSSLPDSAIALTAAGAAATLSPETKNVALASFSLRMSNISDVHELGPSSNVRAMYFFPLVSGVIVVQVTSAFTTSSTTPLSATMPVFFPVQTSERPGTPHVCTKRSAPVPSTVSVGSMTVASTSCFS